MSAEYRKDKFIVMIVAAILLVLACIGALLLSFWIVHEYIDVHVKVNLQVVTPIVCVLTLALAVYNNCFDFGGRRAYDIVYSMYLTLMLTGLIVLALPFVIVGYQASKKVMLGYCLIQLVIMPVWAICMRKLYFKKVPPMSAVFVSDMSGEGWIAKQINKYNYKYDIRETVNPSSEDLKQVVKRNMVVVVGCMSAEERHRLLEMCATYGKTVLVRPDYTDIMAANSKAEQFGDLMMMHIKSFGMSIGDRAAKRVIDVLLSVIASVIALPIILVCALAIVIEDGKNPFFTQERLTRGGRAYKVIKLRTMIVGAEKATGAVLAEKEDPRITKVGGFLRKMRLDELPQLFNILVGDMSFVGPRPEREFFYNEFEKDLPEFHLRLSVKGGLTGVAQVWGKYSTDPREKLMMDLMYIQNYSVMLDIRLIFETVRVLFTKDSAEGVDKSDSRAAKKRGKQKRRKG